MTKSKWFLLFLLTAGLPAAAQQPVIGVVDSNAIKTLFFAGLRDKLTENYPKAAESFTKILMLDPDHAPAYYELAGLYYRQNKLPEAEMAIKKATALNADNLWYWRLTSELYKRKSDMDALVLVFNQMIRLDPENDSFYFDRSNALMLAGKTEEALTSYNEIERKFGSSEALVQARQRAGGAEQKVVSKEVVDQLLAKETTDIKGLLGTSTTLIEKGQYADALPLLKKAKEIDAADFEIDLELADVYKGLKNNAEAHASLRSAFNNPLMPADQKAKIIMMLFAGAKNPQRINDAAELAQLAVKSHPNDPDLLSLYGSILVQQEKLTEALDQLLSVLKLTDDRFKVWEQVLNIQIHQSSFKDAIKTADQALSIFPNQGVLYFYLAVAQEGEQLNKEALKTIQSALQLDGENAVYMEYYGDLLFLTGDQSGAVVQWKKAKAAGSTSDKLNRKINEKKYIK
ncbi:tetratricopeptide repeat protein [Pedobacter metabolipauper]|uniref:Tetratricopeptide repeat protein n=1 Tax=Pedobacter metabolipauper TaxID=425513 RepID=A0A4R6SXX1_9SPHI|nr:tetratricopeptide repeat protein [Pedobacter metabolipauper]TDQ10063.1 tetratricopeptide repeat protein [Pedobacter metabolipauper]